LERQPSRQGFLVSALVHVLFLIALSTTRVKAPVNPNKADEPPRERARVFMPTQEELRRLAPRRPTPPRPTPPPALDRMSVGAPSEVRQKGPLILRRDDDLTQTRKGRPDGTPPSAQPAPPSPSSATPQVASAPEQPVNRERPGNGLELPLGRGPQANAPGAAPQSRTTTTPSIASALRSLDQRLATSAVDLGTTTGSGRQMGPLFFDPQGADFTRWINQFKTEVYRNWILPQPALLGLKGHVEIELTVTRDGSLSQVQVVKPSGIPSFDRAAENALVGSRFLPLPDDFRPNQVTMRVTFFYNEVPQGA